MSLCISYPDLFLRYSAAIYRPEKTKGKSGYSGSSPGNWYSGWNCMKTLITKGLVVKSSCPAKYDYGFFFSLLFFFTRLWLLFFLKN